MWGVILTVLAKFPTMLIAQPLVVDPRFTQPPGTNPVDICGSVWDRSGFEKFETFSSLCGTSIILDSGAAKSVCGPRWANAFIENVKRYGLEVQSL